MFFTFVFCTGSMVANMYVWWSVVCFNLLWRYNEQIIKNIVFQLSFYWRTKSNILNTWTWCFNTITDQHVNCFEKLWSMKMSMYWIDFESTCIVKVNTMFENMVDKNCTITSLSIKPYFELPLNLQNRFTSVLDQRLTLR